MKRLIYMTILLLGFAAFTACNKDNIKDASDIVGNWRMERMDFYFDGQEVVYNPSSDCVIYLQDGSNIPAYISSWSIELGMLSYQFKDDGKVYLSGLQLSDWVYDNGTLKFSNLEIGTNNFTNGYISDGNICLERTVQISGYKIIDLQSYFNDFIYNADNPDWIPHDDKLHELKIVCRLAK